MLKYVASPTGEAFMKSRAFVKLIMGPVGGGKSTVCLFDLLGRAMTQAPNNGVRRTKFIIMRNTMGQLMATVKPLIDQWLVDMTRGAIGEWRLTEKVFEMRFALPDRTLVHSELCMMAADTPDDVRRLLSVEASAAWVEEAREVDPQVFQALQGRVARFPNRASGGVTYPGVICSTNPPPVGGFWHELITKPPRKHEVFTQPAAMLEDGSLNPEAENLEHLDPEYYDNLISGKTEAWIDVYIKNKFGPGDFGQPVFKASFRRAFHTASNQLKPVMQSVSPLIVGLDNGLQAAAVIGQRDARGRINILDEAYVPEDTTMGVEAFLDRILVPKLRERFPFRPDSIVFVLDPACFQRSQVDEKTIAQAVQMRGYSVRKSPITSNDIERRLSAVEDLLTRQIDGAAALLIDPRCKHLLDALDWGYRYKKMASTGQTTTTPDKMHHSHIADALQYFASHYVAESFGSVFRRNAKVRNVAPSSYTYV